MSNTPTLSEPLPREEVRGLGWFWADFVLTLAIFALFAGNQVPDVNEPHYWIKAAHYWKPALGGGDIFLESGDVHWAFYATFGYLTTFLPMPQSVWIGRWVTWIALALSWTYLLHGLFTNSGINRAVNQSAIPNRSAIQTDGIGYRLIACLAAPAWLAAMTWGNWAGEWVVGGCESKGIAYACFFAGIGCIARGRTTWGWMWIGVGSMFHVVTGLWVIATVGLASIILQIVREKIAISAWLRLHVLGWILCIAGFLAGAIPALQMDLQTGKDAKSQAAEAQVYTRLGHHLAPTRFSETRWRGFFALLATTSALLLITRSARWIGTEERFAGQDTEITRQDANLRPGKTESTNNPQHWRWITTAPPRVRWLFTIAQLAFAIAMFGLLFDLSFSFIAPKFAASILRFYWFRWNEVTWPMSLAVVAVAVGIGSLQLSDRVRSLQLQPQTWRRIVALVTCLSSIWILRERVIANSSEVIPAGERQSFSLKTDTPEEQREQFKQWIAVCDWIVANMPQDGLWLTPRRQQSFKWRTLRPELASWKDMPQNASAVVVWNERLQDAFVYDSEKQLQPISDEQMARLSSKYGFRYVLLDLRVERQTIPPWRKLYPESAEQNPLFVVLEVPENTTANSSETP